MALEPNNVAYGISDADRETLSTLLSLFEDTEVVGMAVAFTRDSLKTATAKVDSWLGKETPTEFVSAVTTRIENGTQRILNSNDDTELLRMRLWLHIWEAFSIDPEVAVSDRSLNSCINKIGDRYAHYVSELAWNKKGKEKKLFSQEYWKDHGQYKWVPFRKAPIEALTFYDSFMFTFQRIIENIAHSEESEAKEELGDRACEYLNRLDEDKRNELLKAANVEQISRESALKILAAQGGLVGTGVATELAGFSAYILAAKASAIIPLVGGKTLVSFLAVIANPLFIIPAVLLVGTVFGAKAAKDISRFMAMNVVTVLSLRGAASEGSNGEPIIQGFRQLPSLIPNELVESYRKWKHVSSNKDKGKKIANKLGSALWRSGKAAFDVSEYPEIENYLKKWEVAMGRNL